MPPHHSCCSHIAADLLIMGNFYPAFILTIFFQAALLGRGADAEWKPGNHTCKEFVGSVVADFNRAAIMLGCFSY